MHRPSTRWSATSRGRSRTRSSTRSRARIRRKPICRVSFTPSDPMPWDEALVNSLIYDRPDESEGRVISYVAAINEALSIALEQDSGVIVLGQGVDDPTAMFGTTKGLQQRFGRTRVFDTPLSEEGMRGVSTGAALNGLRPVYMHNRPDFVLLAFNQLVTHAAKIHFMDNGRTSVPLVVWAAVGRG